MKKALVCGVSGQDDPYLAELLLGKGGEACIRSYAARSANLPNLARLEI